MKHFINIFITIILVGFVIGLTYIIYIDTATKSPNGFGILYLPLLVMMAFWGVKLHNDY